MSVRFGYQGFDINSQWDGALLSSSADLAFATMAAAGSNAVGLTPKLFVQNSSSSTFVTDATASTSDASLIAGIRKAEVKGLKVLLEPHVVAFDGSISSVLTPSDPAAFFASYKAAIVHLATIAQQTGVDTFSIGNELGALTGSAYRFQWLDIIAAVRAVYSGKLTYEAATNEASSVSFWDKVDTIGFNAYLPLSAADNPSVSDLEKAWTTAPANNYWSNVLDGKSIVDFMHSLATSYGKQVLITEVGYQSIVGTATHPGDSLPGGTTPSTADQANAYQALLQTMQQQGGSWFAGLNFWEYAIGRTDAATNYSPLGKPAMSLVQNYFSGSAAVSGLTIAGSPTSDLIDVGAGNDTINAGLGNDVIRGGAGNDTIIAGPSQITRLATTTVTFTGYGLLGRDGSGAQVALAINGQQVGATATLTPAADASGYQTFTVTFANPDHIDSLDLSLLNGTTGAAALLRGITINGASLSTTDITNLSAPGTFNIYGKPLHLDATGYQDWFYGAQTDNDIIEGGAGNDTIDGGAGIDTAVYQGPMSAYTFTASGNKLIVTDSVASRDGQDTLSNVEYLQFSDKTVAVASLHVARTGSVATLSLMAPLVTAATLTAPASGSGNPLIALSGVSVAGATVVLLNGSAVLGTTTADASGNYSFQVAAPGAGLYSLATSATDGALVSPVSDATLVAVGSAQTIVGLLTSTTAAPDAVYLTDPTDPIVVSVAQMRAIAFDLTAAVTGFSLAVADTSANVVAGLDSLGAQGNVTSITLTDTNVFNVTQALMTAMIADDAGLLAMIVGGYSFLVTSTNPAGGSTTNSRYDATGTLTSMTVVTTKAGTIETYTRSANGASSDVFTTTAGVKISEYFIDSSGKRYVVYGLTGRPYATQAYAYDATGKLTSLKEYYAAGGLYSGMTVGPDGTTATILYDTAGNPTQMVVVAPGGATETTTYDAAGALLTDKVVDASGTRFTQYGVTGQPYVTLVFGYDATGRMTSLQKLTANGSPYSLQTNAADGTVTLDSYTAGVRTQRVITAADGSSDTQTFSAGALVTDYLRNADGTRDLYDYRIAGKPYTADQMIFDASGRLTEILKFTTNGNRYSDQQNAANGSVTLDSYVAGLRTQRVITNVDGSSETQSFSTAGMLTMDVIRHANGTRDLYDYGITGQPYTADHMIFDASGKVTEILKFTASGTLYSDQKNASSSVTYDSYVSGVRAKSAVTSTDGSSDTKTYNAAGTVIMDDVRHANGTRDLYDYAITGKAYTADHMSFNASGKVTAVTKYAADGAATVQAYGSGLQLAGTPRNDSFTSFGGDTFTFSGKFGSDTVSNFHAGAQAGHDTISLSKHDAIGFSNLSVTQVMGDTRISYDHRDVIVLTSVEVSAIKADVVFV